MTVITRNLDHLATRVAVRTVRNGGCTIDPVTGSTPTTGYALAVPGFEQVTEPGFWDLADIVADYVRDNRSQLAPFGRYLGTWEHDGRLYLDVVQVVTDRDDALALAESRGELAIYDLSAGVEIAVAS